MNKSLAIQELNIYYLLKNLKGTLHRSSKETENACVEARLASWKLENLLIHSKPHGSTRANVYHSCSVHLHQVSLDSFYNCEKFICRSNYTHMSACWWNSVRCSSTSCPARVQNERHNGVNLFIWLTTNLSCDSFTDGFALRPRGPIAFRSRVYRLHPRQARFLLPD